MEVCRMDAADVLHTLSDLPCIYPDHALCFDADQAKNALEELLAASRSQAKENAVPASSNGGAATVGSMCKASSDAAPARVSRQGGKDTAKRCCKTCNVTKTPAMGLWQHRKTCKVYLAQHGRQPSQQGDDEDRMIE